MPAWSVALRLPLARVAIALSAQMIVALLLVAKGSPSAWRWAAGWWVAWLVPVNIATLIVLVRVQRAAGARFADLFAPPARPPRRDLPWYLLALAASVPLGILPNLWLGRLLWGSAFAGVTPSFAALPLWLVGVLTALVPVTQGLTEPALYLGYVLPRVRRLAGRPGRGIAVTAAAMSLQNLFLPWLFDWRFAVWRGLMFAPLSLWLAWLVARPTNQKTKQDRGQRVEKK